MHIKVQGREQPGITHKQKMMKQDETNNTN